MNNAETIPIPGFPGYSLSRKWQVLGKLGLPLKETCGRVNVNIARGKNVSMRVDELAAIVLRSHPGPDVTALAGERAALANEREALGKALQDLDGLRRELAEVRARLKKSEDQKDKLAAKCLSAQVKMTELRAVIKSRSKLLEEDYLT